MNETCLLVVGAGIGKDAWLKVPVEFPRLPPGVNVPDATISTVELEED